MAEFTLTDIDPYNCSLEELDKEIARLKSLKEEYYNLEQSIKIFINSCYGAVGSPWFSGYNVALAEAVTLQGQDMIKYANNFLDDYFLNKWHIDKKLHEALGLTSVNKIQTDTIVIYNDTDSVARDTVIKSSSGEKTIEDFYNENIKNGSAGETDKGHESVITGDKILNWSEDKNLYYAPVKRIIRHKVSKSKWKLKTKSGKEIIVTNDHSMIVFRNGKKLEVKPSEILKTDKILCAKSVNNGYYFDDIESIESIGEFDEEYVYDIEVDDDNHTFIGNDILVHNSTYITLGPLVKSCDWKGNPKDLLLKINKLRLEGFIEKMFEQYAKKYNTGNLQNLELEKISYSSLMVAKKKYILNIAWKDPGIDFEPQQKVTPVGVEIVQGSTPPFSRRVLKELLTYFFSKGKNLEYSDIVKRLKEYKKQFLMQDPNDISKTVSIGDYEKYVLEDRKEIRLAEKCPINVRAAAVYNHHLFNTKWKGKYNLINTGDKLKYYYAKSEYEVFGFLPSDYPGEFAPEVDYDKQFEKVIIEPFNRFMAAAGFQSIPGNLIYSKALF